MSVSSRTIVQGSALSSIGMIVSMVLALGAAIIFTHALTEEEVGIFAVLILVTDLVVMVNNCGLISALPKLVAAAPEGEAPRLIRSSLFYQLLFSVLLALPVYGVWVFVDDPSVLSKNESWIGLFPYLWLLPPFFLFANLRENAMAALAGINRYGFRAAGLIAAAGANFALVALLTWQLSGGLAGLMAATLASSALAALWFCIGLPLWRRLRFAWRPYRDAMAFSWPLYLNQILTFAFLRLDTLFVAVFLGPAAAAYFEYGAKKLPGYFSRLLLAALTPYLPSISTLIAADDRAGATRLADEASNFFMFIGYAGILATLIVQTWIITLLFPEEYLQGIPALGLMMVAICLTFQAGIMGLTLVALGKPHLITIVNAVAAGFSVVVNIVCIPLWGIVGAGWAAVLASAFGNLAQVWYVRRNGISIRLGRYGLLHGVFAGTVLVSVLGATPLWRAGALVLFLVLSVVCGLVRIKDFTRILARLTPRFGKRENGVGRR